MKERKMVSEKLIRKIQNSFLTCMEVLKRKIDLSTNAKEIALQDGTKIKVRRITVRKIMQVTNNKSLSEQERGMHILAAKLLVCLPGESRFREIVYDDLLDNFTDEEVNGIVEKMAEEGEKNA
jgi:hypothetical protein